MSGFWASHAESGLLSFRHPFPPYQRFTIHMECEQRPKSGWTSCLISTISGRSRISRRGGGPDPVGGAEVRRSNVTGKLECKHKRIWTLTGDARWQPPGSANDYVRDKGRVSFHSVLRLSRRKRDIQHRMETYNAFI